MTGGLLIAILSGLGLIFAGALLAIACLWWRFGSSPSARWWVRRAPVSQLRSFPAAEGAALVLLPVTAQTLVFLGLLICCAPLLLPATGWSLALLIVVLLAQCGIWLVARGFTAYRWVLPLWAYPGWLREERRRDRDQLPADKR